MGAVIPIGARAVALVLLAATSIAQTELPAARIRRVEAPVRDAGVYHAATSTWTRKASVASLGADVVYDNTSPSGYYYPLSGDTIVDEGRLPSPTSPVNLSSRPGCSTSYTIDGFQIAYCTDRVAPAPFHIRFFQSYVGCSSVIGVTPTADIQVSGAPGAAGSSACWTVTIDLEGPPGGPSLAFAMLADGDGSYSGTASSNLFGWSFTSTAPWADQLATGPFIAGDPSVAQQYDGTRWDSPVNYLEDGTGMSTQDFVRSEGGPSVPSCYYWGGTPFLSIHLELYADACEGATLATPFCFGSGSPNPCPCENSSPGSGAGCRNSLGQGARLMGSGHASLASDTFVLAASAMPPTAPALYFQGTDRVNGGAGQHFGDGLRCIGGSLVRLRVVATGAGGGSTMPAPTDPTLAQLGQVTGPGVRTYQVWYRNAASYCTPATFNLTNGLEISWVP